MAGTIMRGGAVAILLLAAFPALAADRALVRSGAGGALDYVEGARGDRVVDFSHAGYGGGGVAIPMVPARIRVEPGPGDDRQRIQAAIELVSALPPDAEGFRGAVLLAPGRFEVEGGLRLAASGVVLRGAGNGEDGTTILATGTGRRALLTVAGEGAMAELPGTRRAVTDAYVPVGAKSLTLDDAAGLKPGDRVVVHRPSVAGWIALLGMDQFRGWRPENRLHWQPGSRDIRWDRVVTVVEGNKVTLDAPLTTALDAAQGGGSFYRYDFPGRIRQVGVEGLRLVSAFDPARPGDEDHAWFAVALDKAEDAWVRQVTALHFVSSAVDVGGGAKRVTVEDVEGLDPVSELGGHRRRLFHIAGQLTLVQRCRGREGGHDLSTGHAAAGPNVFLDCVTENSHDFSGPLGSWASGVLFDGVRIRGDALRLTNRERDDQGAGWAAANSVLWNCEATDLEVRRPPGADNQAYGCRGIAVGDGIVDDPRASPFRDFHRGMPIQPQSLYRAQLAERLGPGAVAAIAPRPLPAGAEGARLLQEAEVAAFASREVAAAGQPGPPLRVQDGRFTIGGEPAWTKQVKFSWFQAQMPPDLAPGFGPALTRFAPGRHGPGLTDDLAQVAAGMPKGGVFYQHYGLWYDRRRVDHNFDGSAERRRGDVWAPFMELPWARSGKGKAWDGLSKYDLTRFNPWYFDRVKGFADLADRKGLVLYYNFYFQHWLLESRSHYVDFPWRPVNTIQDTGLPDEVPAAEGFYDLSSPLRRDLHRLYIFKVLDTLKDNANVVYGIDREYTGPVSFVRFWLDTIAEWQRRTGRKVHIALEIPKDQTDAILEDPARGPLVSAIDFHHWVYRPDGRLFYAKGGTNRAPREQMGDIVEPGDLAADPAAAAGDAAAVQALRTALWKGTPATRYRALREYRDRYPDLVLLSRDDPFPALSRGVEATVPREMRAAARPVPLQGHDAGSSWAIGAPGQGYLVYATAGGSLGLDLRGDPGTYAVIWVDGSSGLAQPQDTLVKGGGTVTLEPPATGKAWAAWLSPASVR